MEPTISLPSPQPPQPLFRTPGGLLNDKENMPKSGANRKRSHSAPNSHTFLKTLPTPPLHYNANESYVANVVDDHCLRCVLNTNPSLDTNESGQAGFSKENIDWELDQVTTHGFMYFINFKGEIRFFRQCKINVA
uniref:WH1 domain-containing protein n=1 Tax=Heterorhabditis bacteriophora TaxID=37862 RepID=A0A1I7WJT2_HETBA